MGVRKGGGKTVRIMGNTNNAIRFLGQTNNVSTKMSHSKTKL